MHSAKKTYDGKIAGLYDLEETLGRGHFAVVKLARHVFTGEKVAVKVIDKTKLDDVSRAHLFQEVRCMKLVQHPNVVRLYEVIDTQTKLYLILEFGEGGDLYDYIMKHEAGLGEDMAKEYFRQIVRAISYCHQLHVVHRDLKPENVVFFERFGVVKLTDFGFSNKFCPGQKLDTSCGSLAYSAPEILLGDSYDAPAVDVWSLGVILYMLVAGQAPFQEANDSETLTMIMDCKYTIPTHVSEACRRLIAKMLVREPESRATLEDIASDPWLGGSPQVEYLPLISRQQVSEEDHNIIISKMVNGNIATKEEILEALDKNEYNHITATYFLLAERKLRAYREEQAENSLEQSQVLDCISSSSNHSLGKAKSQDSATSDLLKIPSTTSTLTIPRIPGETVQSKTRKCSIVQEEEDEDDYCGIVGPGQELLPPHSSLNRRGSRSEGKLNLAIQERIAEERRKEKKESPNSSPHPSNGRIGAKDDSSWPNKRMSPTSIHSGIPASYIPGTTSWRVDANKNSLAQNLPAKANARSDSNFKIENGNVAGNPVMVNECKSVGAKSVGKDKQTDVKVINSSQVITPPKTIPPKIKMTSVISEFAAISLKESATITIPYHPTPAGASLSPKFKTMPSPSRNSNLISHDMFDGVSELSVPVSGDSLSGENKSSRIGVTSINCEQRKSKFHKARTGSCSSSDASDDDSESRKKRAQKISLEKNNQRRDSHDDSSDSQDQGGSSGAGGNTASGLGSEGDGVHNQNQSTNSNQENRSSGSGDHSREGNTRNHRQCNGENFRRNRRRTGETRLRESQSLNRIMEVQESEGNSHSIVNVEVHHGKMKNCENEPRKPCPSNPATPTSNNNVSNSEKSKSGKSLGARFLQSWSNTISSTKLSVQKKKSAAEGRNQRAVSEIRASEISEHLPKHYSDEKENKATLEKTGKKMKVLGRYFQVSKKLCIPLPTLSAKGRLYKARSCGSISKDKITSTVSTGTSTLKPALNGSAKNENGNVQGVFFGRSKSPNILINQSLDSLYTNSLKKSSNKSANVRAGKSKTPVSSDVSNDFQAKPIKGDVNKNVKNGNIFNINSGVCRMQVRDAAESQLS